MRKLTHQEADSFSRTICKIADYILTAEGLPCRVGAVSSIAGHIGNVTFESRESLEEGETHTIRVNLNSLLEDSDLKVEFFNQYKNIIPNEDMGLAFLVVSAHEAGHVVHYENALATVDYINNFDEYMGVFGIPTDLYNSGYNGLPERYAEDTVFKYFHELKEVFKDKINEINIIME